MWSNLWFKNSMLLSQYFLTSFHTRPGKTSLTSAQMEETLSWNRLFMLHRQLPGGRPLGRGCQQHTGNFTERGTLQVTWKIKAYVGLGRVRGHLRYVAKLSVYILENDPLVLYVYPALWVCFCGHACYCQTGVEITWANNEEEWYVGFDLCVSQKSKWLFFLGSPHLWLLQLLSRTHTWKREKHMESQKKKDLTLT